MIIKYLSFFKRRFLKNNYLFHYRLKQLQNQREYSRDCLLELQNKKLLNLVKHAYQYSDFYHNLYDEHGVDIGQIKDIRDFVKLPVISKETVKQQTKRILTTSSLYCTKAFTSGTSGSPLMVYRDYRSMIEEEAYLWRHRIEFGHNFGERSVSLRGDLNRNVFSAYDIFSNTLHLSSYLLNGKNLNNYYDTIKEFRPNALYAYPSSAEVIANYLIDNDLFLQIPYIFTSSETVYDFQRQKIEKAFNGRLVDWYGNAERSIALEESKSGGYNELLTYSVNEYHENYTISTSLINSSFPLIRYEVPDVIIYNKEKNLVDKIIGRIDDSVLLPDGTLVGRLGSAFKDINDIKFAQIIQNVRDELEIRIVPRASYTYRAQDKIINNLKKRLGSNIGLRIIEIREEQLIKSKRGKYKLVVNQLLNSNKNT